VNAREANRKANREAIALASGRFLRAIQIRAQLADPHILPRPRS